MRAEHPPLNLTFRPTIPDPRNRAKYHSLPGPKNPLLIIDCFLLSNRWYDARGGSTAETVHPLRTLALADARAGVTTAVTLHGEAGGGGPI